MKSRHIFVFARFFVGRVWSVGCEGHSSTFPGHPGLSFTMHTTVIYSSFICECTAIGPGHFIHGFIIIKWPFWLVVNLTRSTFFLFHFFRLLLFCFVFFFYICAIRSACTGCEWCEWVYKIPIWNKCHFSVATAYSCLLFALYGEGFFVAGGSRRERHSSLWKLFLFRWWWCACCVRACLRALG